MKQYNYKCIVAKNSTKMYYKRVGGKWKRVSNAIGMKAEKGKRKYSDNGSDNRGGLDGPFKSRAGEVYTPPDLTPEFWQGLTDPEDAAFPGGR